MAIAKSIKCRDRVLKVIFDKQNQRKGNKWNNACNDPGYAVTVAICNTCENNGGYGSNC
ncbi:hypothetical protein FACI_IFERC00001G1843 [Ferroplasma acidarmanus Fer1]|uniref:Uncharacterized protein n=1 Tax=Ferroplasma acidarmanus Fer1 TaxID=333146 RepID=S0AS69_FERAC|nr:hypothetical protein FACI_IFERC00001G1843 [Ferroplasma acidarmanus Fer1]